MALKQLQPVRIKDQENNGSNPDNDPKAELILVSRNRGAHPDHNRKTQPETAALVALTLFLISNIICFSFSHNSPDQILLKLGPAPKSLYVCLAYAFFVITEIVLLICRLGCKHVPHHAWRKLGFLLAFHLFFWLSGTMQENFVLLLATGSGLLFSEYIRLLRLTIKAVAATAQTESEF